MIYDTFHRPAWLLPATLAVSLALLAGCARMFEATPAPEYFDTLDALFTRGVPDEQPLPPLRTEGLSTEDIRAVQVYRDHHRAVVNVTTLSAYRSRISGTVPARGLGSGVIVDPGGIVVTNHHVVAGAQRVVLTLYDGSMYPAELLGSDPEMDLAVLRFDSQGRVLGTVPMGDSAALQVGQRVFALGNPFGLEGTFTAGVVSALNRPLQLDSGYIIRDLIQSDAAVNPGNSGGPLLNASGQLVGINSLMIAPTPGSVGISLAVPSNTVDRIVTHILSYGRVERGWIDIEGIALTDRLAELAGTSVRRGILVTRAASGGNADRAGIRGGAPDRQVRHGTLLIPLGGDVLIGVNGEPVTNVAGLLASLEATRPGDQARLTLVRDGQRFDVSLALGRRPAD